MHPTIASTVNTFEKAVVRLIGLGPISTRVAQQHWRAQGNPLLVPPPSKQVIGGEFKSQFVFRQARLVLDEVRDHRDDLARHTVHELG